MFLVTANYTVSNRLNQNEMVEAGLVIVEKAKS